MRQFCTTGSKAVPALNGNVNPSGSYPALGNLMSEWSRNKLVASDRDWETYFDSTGRYHIKEYSLNASEYKISQIFTLTVDIHVILNDDSNLQQRRDLIAINWYGYIWKTGENEISN